MTYDLDETKMNSDQRVYLFWANKIISEMYLSRSGFDDVWYMLDQEIQDEIKFEIGKILLEFTEEI